MSKHGLARHHAADAMKQRVAKCVRWAFRYVRRTVDKISNAPTVRMPVALPCQRIVRCDQRTMHLTGDYATKPKQSAHEIIVLGNFGEFMFSVRDAYRKSGSQCWLRQTRMMLSGQNASKVRGGQERYLRSRSWSCGLCERFWFGLSERSVTSSQSHVLSHLSGVETSAGRRGPIVVFDFASGATIACCFAEMKKFRCTD